MKRSRAEAWLRCAGPRVWMPSWRGMREGLMVNLKGLMMILELHQQGLSASAIAERPGRDREIVRKVSTRGLVVAKYPPRERRPTLLGPYEHYLRERVAAWPELSGARLLREVRECGYGGGITRLNDFLRTVRLPPVAPFEVRFEMPAGRQAQVDFAEFVVQFAGEAAIKRKVWLFAMVLGHSRYLWAQYVLHQDLATVLRCHMEAFEHFGGAPREILYDRMKTAVLGEPDEDKPIGCVSVGGNYYSVPDGVLEVETTADQVRIHEDDKLIAVHARLHGRRQRSVLPGHRHVRQSKRRTAGSPAIVVPGHVVARPLPDYPKYGLWTASSPDHFHKFMRRLYADVRNYPHR